ncbi:hypothetical protein QJS04_geneDACA022533 [Acorus gramineus]|uniref:Uncharacterized protein n=1 Tax=Acorus gramineus TaxID=55184 RepID=A0AAV9A8Y1_ACOGR|nr:hypothetical protein QJS04_geneDACA022533 [Acorus gramineus]
MKSEGLEISQPAIDPVQSEVHYKITMHDKTGRVHRGNSKCSNASKEPPCRGLVEGMAPVFSNSAWRCAWQIMQNDHIHGWGMDLKLGYLCTGDHPQKVGIIDSEIIVHRSTKT